MCAALRGARHQGDRAVQQRRHGHVRIHFAGELLARVVERFIAVLDGELRDSAGDLDKMGEALRFAANRFSDAESAAVGEIGFLARMVWI